jgi:hypothetical protein
VVVPKRVPRRQDGQGFPHARDQRGVVLDGGEVHRLEDVEGRLAIGFRELPPVLCPPAPPSLGLIHTMPIARPVPRTMNAMYQRDLVLQ